MVAVGIATAAGLTSASVFYKFNVVAETGLPPFNLTGLGNGPSINDEGKVAYIGRITQNSNESVFVWSPVGGNTDVAPGLHPQNRTFGEGARINGNDEVAVWTHTFPSLSAIYEIRVLRGAGPIDNGSVAVRGVPGGPPYDGFYPFPWINNTKVLEDRSAQIPTGNKDGICDAGETCFSQTAFNAFLIGAPTQRYIGTVVQNPFNAADAGVQHQFGLLTQTSRPVISDDGRVLVRGNAPSNPIILFNNYALSSQTQIAGAAAGFTVLGQSPGMTSDGKVVAFAGNRGQGDGIFLSIQQVSGPRRLVRIVGENTTYQKEELGFDGAGKKLFMQSISVDSRVGIVYTPDADGVANGSVVVSFIGTPNAGSRINPGNGKPFLFSSQQGLWTIRIDLTAILYKNICNVRAPGVTGNPFVVKGDDQVGTAPNTTPFIDAGANGVCESENLDTTETLFSRTSPIPVVQIGDIVKSPNTTYTVASIAVHDPIAGATTDDALIPRAARIGDHRVVFWAADASNNQFIVRGDHLDSDQDGLLDHWETSGIDLTGTGTIDLDLAAMGANPFKRDLFIQLDWTADRAQPLNPQRRHPPAPGILRQLDQFYAAAPALPSGVPAGIVLHVDAGPGLDGARQFFSRHMGTGPVRGGKIVSATPLDIVYFGRPGSVSLTGVNAADFDSVKAANFWAFNHGAREFVFRYLVMGDHPDATPNNVTPFTGTVTSADATSLADANQRFSVDVIGGVVKITGGTGAGQLRSIRSPLLTSFTVIPAWNVTPDATSTYVTLDGAGGNSHPGERYDGAFSAGNNIGITLGGFNQFTPGNYQGSFIDEWQTLAHELGHILSLKHGGADHDNYKPTYLSLMNYAYQNCPAGRPARDGNGALLSGAAACPINDYARATDPVFFDWGHLDMKSALNFQRTGQAFGSEISPPQPPFPSKHVPANQQQIELRFGPPDAQAPTVTITSPANGVVVVQGNSIPVTFTATDNVAVVKAEVFFDVNGDRTVADPAEVFTATPGGANTYSVTIPAISGPNTARYLTVMAYDPTGNPGVATIVINVGAVPGPVLAPNVVNQPLETAASTIAALNLFVGTVTQQPSLSVPAGSIVSQIPPAGQSVPVLTAIDVVLSSGNTTVVVPNGVGMTQAAASTAMTSAGLTLGPVTMLPSSSVPSGSVISQLPLAGAQVAAATTVTLTVSTGPGSVVVPDVTNQPAADAANAITGIGLAVGTITRQTSLTVASGAVISQSPIGGTSIPAGTPVNLTVSSGDGTVVVPSVVGRTQAEATSTINNNALVVGTVTMQASSTVPAGSVISQTPVAGAAAPFGASVDLVVSSGPPNAQRTAVSPMGFDTNPCTFSAPCRTFDRAISLTQPGGEVIVLDSAGYGPMTIDRAITIAAASGVYAGISVGSGTGIVVNPGSGRVTLKGLTINGIGGARGIDLQSGDALYIDDCIVSGFTQAGLFAQPLAATGIHVRRVAFRSNGTGIATGLAASGLLELNVDAAKFEGNGTGLSIAAFGAVGTLRASSFVGNGTGLSVAPAAGGASARLEVSKTTFKGNGTSIVAGGVAGTTSTVNLTSSLVAGSGTVGLSSAAGGTAFVADTTITRNATGLQQTAGGTAVTFGNNRLVNNTTNGAFTSSAVLK